MRTLHVPGVLPVCMYNNIPVFSLFYVVLLFTGRSYSQVCDACILVLRPFVVFSLFCSSRFALRAFDETGFKNR